MSPFTIAVPLILLMGAFLFTTRKRRYLNYREGRPEDLPRMKELALLSYGIFEKDLSPGQFKTLKERLCSDALWDQLMQKSLPFVCEDYDRLVGMVFLFPRGNPEEHFHADWSYIRLLGVDPEYAGKGIASELTRRCIHEAEAAGECMIALHTSEYMNAARHVYEKLGFKKQKELEPRYGKRYWLYLMPLNRQE